MLCVVVSTAQSGMALRSFRRAAPPCEPQRFSAINRMPSTMGGCVERMNVWRACGWRVRFEVVCPARTESERQRCAPHSPSRPPARAAPICTCLARSTTSPRDPRRAPNPKTRVLLHHWTPCGLRGVRHCMARCCAWPGLADITWIAVALERLGLIAMTTSGGACDRATRGERCWRGRCRSRFISFHHAMLCVGPRRGMHRIGVFRPTCTGPAVTWLIVLGRQPSHVVLPGFTAVGWRVARVALSSSSVPPGVERRSHASTCAWAVEVRVERLHSVCPRVVLRVHATGASLK
jgi:hypothetical protein